MRKKLNWASLNFKSFALQKIPLRKWNDNPQNRKNICKEYVSWDTFIQKVLKNSYNSTTKTQPNFLNGKNIWTDISSKKIYKQLTTTRTDAQGHQGNANQNHDEIPFHTHWDGYSKKASVGKNIEKLEPLYTAGDNIK